MSPTPQGLDALDPRVNRALQDFLERMDRGEVVDQEQFLSQHQEIADQLRSFIADAADLARRATPDAVPAAEVSTNRSMSETIPPTAPGAAPALPEVFGRYRVIRLLGRGAMGAVYLADDTQLARQVALKIPHFDNTQPDELLQRFYREARTAATLRNPHICPVYDVGEINGQHYISMAYIEGHPLSEIIKAKGPQPERQVLTLVRKLALALQEAHNQGVIHRDLKPGNIMVDARGEPVVMDFGLACQVREGAERLTHSGVILGSPAYMSPEQLEGSTTKVTPSADQYALGVILYELLTGQLPFRGTISAVVGQIITKPAPAPKVLRPELDQRINELCLQMLAKTPAKRLDSMKAVADRILAIMKEPAKTESSAPAPVPSAGTTPAVAEPVAETIVPMGANSQQQVATLIKQGELQAALDVLGPLAQRKTGKLAEWARQKQGEVRALLQTGQRDQAALCLLAGKLIRKADYAEAVRILSEIPVPARTDELTDLLSDAEAKEEEANLLLQDIETAVRKDQPKELPALVKRFLQLKPGNKAIRTLAEDLKRYGAEKVIRLRRNQRNFLDVAGATWNPMHAVYFLVGLALVCASVYAAAIAFQTPNGTVIVEVYDPHVVVKFANEEITATSSGKTYRLKTTDRKTLQIEVDGVTIDSSTQEITVERNETKIITAKLVDGKLDLAINREKKSFAIPDAAVGQQKPSNEAKEQVGEWIDLLATADLAEMKGSNFQWTRNGGVLTGKVLAPATYAWIPFITKQEIKGDYDLEIDYLAVGTDHLQIGLPLNETIGTLGLNEKKECGLDWIDGLAAEAHENNIPPHGNPDVHMKPGVVQHVTASVRHDGDNVTLITKLDDIETGRFSSLRSRISTPDITSPKPGRIKLVSPFQSKDPDHRLEIHKARVRFITKEPSSRLTSNGNSEKTAEWVDLLNPLDVSTITNSNNRLTREGSHIRGTLKESVNDGWVIFTPPTEIKGDFDLEFDYLVEGCAYMKVGMPLGDSVVDVAIGRGGTRLDGLDGPKRDDVLLPPLGNPDMPMKSGVIQHLTVSVRHENDTVQVESKLDGVETGRYVGSRQPFQKIRSKFSNVDHFKVASQFLSRTPDHRIEFHKARVRFVNRSVGTASDDKGWTSLFNGRDLTNWSTTPDVWQVRDGVLEIDPARIKENSYLWSADSYTDFELRFRYRLKNEGYLGLGMHFSLDEGLFNVGPLLQLGYFQPKGKPNQLDAGGLFALIDRKPTSLVGVTDQTRYQFLPVIRDGKENGKWSDITVRCEGRRIRAEINGIQTVDFTDNASQLPLSGKLAFYSPTYQKAAAEIKDVRIRNLSAGTSAAISTPTSAVPNPASASPGPSKILLDADFRKGPMGFNQGDYDFLLAEEKNGEYRYMGKKPGWWYGSLHPEFWKSQNNQLRNFAIELDVRLASTKRGNFAVEFGRVGDETMTLRLNQLGQVQLVRGTNTELVSWTTSRDMKPVSQFNTLRLSVENKTVKVSANGSTLFEKRLDRYTGGGLALWLIPDETPFDVRLQRIRIERLGSDESSLRTREVRRFKGHTAIVRGVAFLPDGQKAVSVGHEKAFKLWEVESGNLLHDFTGHTDHVTSVSVSGDGRRALTGCWDKQVRLWDLEERKLLKTLKGHTDKVVSVLLSRDGQSGLSLSNDGVIRQWDLKAGKSTVVPGPAPYGVLAINPAENVIASGNGDGTVTLRGSKGVGGLSGHAAGYVEGLAFSPDGKKLVTGGDDGTVRVWDLDTLKPVHKFETEGVGFDSVVITADGRYIIAGCGDQTIVSWDILTGEKVATIHASKPVTHRLALSPDNQFALTGGGDIGWRPIGDYDLRLWRLPNPPAPK